MSGFRMLLCLDGSPASLEAARLALELAPRLGAEVRAVAVVENHETTRGLPPRYRRDGAAREQLEHGAHATLERFAVMAQEQGIRIETEMLRGDTLRVIIEDARGFGPDLVVIGRTGRSGPGSPMIGSLALQLLEFTEWPVIVVPQAHHRARRSARI